MDVFGILKEDKCGINVKCPNIDKAFRFERSSDAWIEHSRPVMKAENCQTRISDSVMSTGLNGSNRVCVNVNIAAQYQWHHIIKPRRLNSNCNLKFERIENFLSMTAVGFEPIHPAIETGPKRALIWRKTCQGTPLSL
jgi:hypothetical protein